MSMDEIHKFYVHELQPFVSVTVSRVCRQLDSLQRPSVGDVQDNVDANNVTLYGSTQLAVDLAELAAEAGNETLAADDVGSTACTQSQTTSKRSTEEPAKIAPADVPIALDGFCLQSSSVNFLHFEKNAVCPGNCSSRIIMLVASVCRHNVTVWHLSVCLSICFLTSVGHVMHTELIVTHQGAAHDAASIHFCPRTLSVFPLNFTDDLTMFLDKRGNLGSVGRAMDLTWVTWILFLL